MKTADNKKSALPSKLTDHYSNILLLAPDGQALATIPVKRANWYKKRKLVEVIDKQEGFTEVLRLTVEPLGRPCKKILPLPNKCVVCGNTEVLSVHHVVPRAIRVFFPSEYKNHSHQWCVLLCEEHHIAAEKLARPLYEKGLQEALSKVHQNYLRLGSGIAQDCWRLKKEFSLEEKLLYKDCRKEAIKLAHKEYAEALIESYGGVQQTIEKFKESFLILIPKFLPDGYLQ